MSIVDIVVGLVENIPLERAGMEAAPAIKRAVDALKAHFAAHLADKAAIDKLFTLGAAKIEGVSSAPAVADPAPPAPEEPDPSIQVGGRPSGTDNGLMRGQ